MDKCPWPECDKPWSEHGGIEKIVHSEKPRGFGSNGGVQCDTRRGPCACGAWH